jgi:hypothetical protein
MDTYRGSWVRCGSHVTPLSPRSVCARARTSTCTAGDTRTQTRRARQVGLGGPGRKGLAQAHRQRHRQRHLHLHLRHRPSLPCPLACNSHRSCPRRGISPRTLQSPSLSLSPSPPARISPPPTRLSLTRTALRFRTPRFAACLPARQGGCPLRPTPLHLLSHAFRPTGCVVVAALPWMSLLVACRRCNCTAQLGVCHPLSNLRNCCCCCGWCPRPSEGLRASMWLVGWCLYCTACLVCCGGGASEPFGWCQFTSGLGAPLHGTGCLSVNC